MDLKKHYHRDMSEQEASTKEEVVIQGVPASPGMAIGKAYVYHKKTPEIEDGRIEEEEISAQIQIFLNARKHLKKQWQKLLAKEKTKQSKAILTAQIAIIDDPDLADQIKSNIKDKQYGAQQAIDKAFAKYIDKLSKTDNAMMADRLIDLSDIRDRLLEAAGTKSVPSFSKNVDILVSKEISPREVIQLSHQNIKGFIMEQGGNTSHAAIIARSVGIPAVVGAKGVMEQLKSEATVCLDGDRGLISINPSTQTRKRVEQLRGDDTHTLEEQLTICRQPSRTNDGTPFTIRANVEFPEELEKVQQFRAKGIGLLRTESVYLNQEQFGSVQKQTAFYEKMLAQTEDHPVVIRLFDVGGDKFQGTKISESNPYLGWRGIRMLLDERSILRDQLKAILITAGQHPGRIKLLVPMVSTVDEITEVKKEVKKCQQNLAGIGMAVDQDISIGIMVEIPSVAIGAASFADQVDFFSIGTNDLTQYLLAVDRGNALISKLYNQAHPAVWKLINHTVEVAQKNAIMVDVCGELAADPVAAACLLGMGVSSLSMSPIRIPGVKKLLLNRSADEMKELAKQVQLCVNVKEVEALFNKWEDNINHV